MFIWKGFIVTAQVLLVFLGGGIGASLRFCLSLALTRAMGTAFPFATLCVNLVGCFLMGAIAGAALKSGVLSDGTRLFLTTGILGGFTTFSTFALEAFSLALRNEALLSFLYAAGSAAGGVLVCALGFFAARALFC